MRRRAIRIVAACALLALAACNGRNDPPSPGGTPGGGEAISGRERIGWTQTAATPGELSTYRYALFVDDDRRVIEGETCTIAANGLTADCTASLPTLGPGRHTLALAAFFTTGNTVVEGERSTVLQVTVGGAATLDGSIVEGGQFQSLDGLILRADVLARDLLNPVDLAVAGDGRVFVAEREGRVRVVGQEHAIPDARDNLLLELGETPGPGGAILLSIAPAPDFATTGFLYLAYTTPQRADHALNIVRLREVRGLLGQPAVVLSSPLASGEVPVILRFGPDGRLHLGVGSGGDARAASDLSSIAGKILRVRADEMSAAEGRGTAAVLSYGHANPRGIAWLPQDQSLWEVEHDQGADEINRIESGASYAASIATGTDPGGGRRPLTVLLDAGSDVSGVATCTARESPFLGDLMVATGAGRDLLRFRIGDDGQPRLVDRLLQGRFGRIGQVAAGPDGSLYFITANQEERGESWDALVRLSAHEHVRRQARD